MTKTAKPKKNCVKVGLVSRRKYGFNAYDKNGNHYFIRMSHWAKSVGDSVEYCEYR